MRNRSAANRAASPPPVPARTSRMAFFSSASSLGRSITRTWRSRPGSSSFRRWNSSSARARISASPSASAISSPRSAISDCASRSRVIAATTWARSAYSLDRRTNSSFPALSWLASRFSSSAWRVTTRFRFSSRLTYGVSSSSVSIVSISSASKRNRRPSRRSAVSPSPPALAAISRNTSDGS